MEKRTSVSLTPPLRTRCSLRYLSINPQIFSNYFILPSKVFDTLVQEGSWNYHKLNISQSEGERKCRQKRETCGSPNSNQIIVDGLRLKKMRGSDVSKDKEKNEDICQYFTSLWKIDTGSHTIPSHQYSLQSGGQSNGQIVEVKVDGSWGSLCDDNFTKVEANLVCKHAGFHLGAKEVRIDGWPICLHVVKVIKRAGFPPGRDRRDRTSPIGSLQCSGWEKCLGECTLDQRKRCWPVGVICR